MLRSLLATAAVSLAMVPAAALPEGAALASRPAAAPKTTTLVPAALARGADTPLLHMAEEVIVDGDLRVPVRGLAHVWLVGRVGTDYVVEAANADYTRYTVRLVHPDGTRRLLQHYAQPRELQLSPDGRRLAMTTVDLPTVVRVVKTRTGDLVGKHSFGAPGAKVSDYGASGVVVGSWDGPTWWWDPGTDTLKEIVDALALADVAADRLVVLTPNPDDPYAFCQDTVPLSNPTKVLWHSCRDIPGAFSPNGRRLVTWSIREDGIGPTLIKLRKDDGTVLRSYRVSLYFGFTEWESNTEVLLQPVATAYAAAVRCDLTDGCERASRLYQSPGTQDPIETMRWSFPK